MKKLIALAVIVLSIMNVSAQKGTMYLGTSGINPFGEVNAIATLSGASMSLSPMTGFTTQSYGDESFTTFGIAPEFGYFIADDMIVGLGVFYTGSRYDDGLDSDDADHTELNMNTFGLNPYFRYLFINKEKFNVYAQAGLTYATSKSDASGAKSINFFDISVMPGISYNLSDRFAINATYGYLGYSNLGIEDADESENSFGLKLDMSTLRFGFTVSF